MQSGDALARHKTNWRELLDGEYARLSRETGCDEVIFLNERGEVAEGSRSNVFVRRGGVLLTPPLSAGILDGCLRRELLDQGKCREAVLGPDDLQEGRSASRQFAARPDPRDCSRAGGRNRLGNFRQPSP